ncbi:amino acid ABC transporter permease [uncultured Faecalibaculum sp.]|nr:amino acid ABC transporter permease [uncultured Faecalibaculum sp.]
MLKGAGASLALALGALFFGVIIGIIMAAMKLSKSKILNVIGTVYVEILRGTPMLLQVLFFYLGVPVLYQMITGTRLRVDPYVVGLIAMSLNSGAYQTELIRSGIQGVDKGQWEACETLGISYVTMMKEVILPQAFKRIIPPMVSEFITLIKDSSLISCIGAAELLYTAQVLGAKYYNYLDPLIIAGCMYLVMTVTISFIARKIEKRMAVSD